MEKKIGAFILYTDQPTLKAAELSVVNQVDEVNIVQKSPVNEAIKYCFKIGCEKYDWFLVFGADTLQKENAIEIYKKYIADDVWSVCGRLTDYYRDDYVNHLYNSKAVKGYKIRDDVNYDHKIHTDMLEEGYNKVITKEITGEHHTFWTPKEAFEKHLHSGKRYPNYLREKYLKGVVKKCLEDPQPFNLASLMGFVVGIIKGNPKPLDGKTSREWEIFKNYFDEKV